MQIGDRIGAYEVIAKLGEGGMGEVYRAVDTRLNRQVAIKILPSEYAADSERVARFAREAQAIAALNHPAVAAIYDVAEADSIRYLVLELVEGETLADRLRREAIGVEDALKIARGICEALEAAHEKGICHRDLKPANIKITPEGAIKVLDFGLAKVTLESSPAVNVTHSPTLSLAGTLPGIILGTAGYMSPEQAKGSVADHRSDIFSLGCILYELLTGRKAFDGETASEILASVLKTDPDYTRLPPRLHPRILELLRRCLEKQPKQRWHSAADVRVEIDAILAGGIFTATPAASPSNVRWFLSGAAGVLLGAVAAGVAVWNLKPEPAKPIGRLSVPLAQGQQFTNVNRQLVAWSPDGQFLVYSANEKLYLRALNDVEPRALAGTDGAMAPTFSPDSRAIAFWSQPERGLKRISVAGGVPITLYTSGSSSDSAAHSIHWSEHGILLVPPGEGIVRVPAGGGKAESLVPETPSEAVAAPQMLPGGRAFLYSIANGTGPDRWDTGRIAVRTLSSSDSKVLIEGGSDGRYVPTGHLVYAVSGILMAVEFDLDRREVVGTPVPVIEGVRRAAYVVNVPPTTQFSFADTGTAAYIAGPASLASAQNDLAIVDRSGKMTRLNLPAGPYEGPRASPDGRFVAFCTNEGRTINIWVHELAGGSSPTRLTFAGKNQFPVWSADSQWVAFASDREGDDAIFRQRADGTGTAERLTKPEPGTLHIPEFWTRSGDRLLYSVAKDRDYTLWSLTVTDRKRSRWGTVQSMTRPQPVVSADGKWIAYQSTETGEDEIFVEPFPDGGGKYMLPSATNNHHPVWSPDGRELFYIPRMGVSHGISVRTTPRFAFGAPVAIERGGRSEGPAAANRNHDLLPDGRFIGVVPGGVSPAALAFPAEIRVILNWFEDLKQRVPAQ